MANQSDAELEALFKSAVRETVREMFRKGEIRIRPTIDSREYDTVEITLEIELWDGDKLAEKVSEISWVELNIDRRD